MSSESRSLTERLREPPPHIVQFAVQQSTFSPCRSKRGVVIFAGDDIWGHGYNFKPRGFDCDGSVECKATCRNEAVHAEQMALICVGLRANARELVHVKTVDGALVPSGNPSCVQCSKLILAAGIAGVWLYHADGWRRYPAAEFHRLSLREAADQIEADAERIRQLEAVADELLEYEPWEPSKYHQGQYSCWFCDADANQCFDNLAGPHKPDCLMRKAQKLVREISS